MPLFEMVLEEGAGMIGRLLGRGVDVCVFNHCTTPAAEAPMLALTALDEHLLTGHRRHGGHGGHGGLLEDPLGVELIVRGPGIMHTSDEHDDESNLLGQPKKTGGGLSLSSLPIKGSKSRLSVAALLDTLRLDVAPMTSPTSTQMPRACVQVGVYLCGPAPFMKAGGEAARAIREGMTIEVHEETFEL